MENASAFSHQPITVKVLGKGLLGIGRVFSWSETELWTDSSLLKQWLRSLFMIELRNWFRSSATEPDPHLSRLRSLEFKKFTFSFFWIWRQEKLLHSRMIYYSNDWFLNKGHMRIPSLFWFLYSFNISSFHSEFRLLKYQPIQPIVHVCSMRRGLKRYIWKARKVTIMTSFEDAE